MYKVLSLAVFAMLFIFTAGYNFDETVFSQSFWISVVMGTAVLFLAAIELVSYRNKKNARSIILEVLYPNRAYRFDGGEYLGGRYIWSLFDLQAKQFRIMRTISSAIPDGFIKTTSGGDEFLIPVGKKLAKGKGVDFVFTEN